MSETLGRVRFRDDHGEGVDRRWGTRRRDTWEIVLNKDGRPVKRDEPVCTEEAGRPLRLLIAARPVRQAAPVSNGMSPALDQSTSLDRAFQRLMRAQGAPSYVLLVWLMTKQEELELSDAQVEAVADRLTSVFVRRNLTGYPPTYALAKLFMTAIDAVGDARGDDVLKAHRGKAELRLSVRRRVPGSPPRPDLRREHRPRHSGVVDR